MVQLGDASPVGKARDTAARHEAQPIWSPVESPEWIIVQEDARECASRRARRSPSASRRTITVWRQIRAEAWEWMPNVGQLAFYLRICSSARSSGAGEIWIGPENGTSMSSIK